MPFDQYGGNQAVLQKPSDADRRLRRESRVSCIQVLLSALMLAFSLNVPVFYRTIGRIGMEVSWNGACTRQRKGFLFKVLEAKRTDYWWSVRLGLSDQPP